MEPSSFWPFRVLVLGGSIRASIKNREKIIDLALKSNRLDQYRERVEKYLADGGALSNSEIVAGAAMLGVVQAGGEVNYFPLVHLFPPKDENVYELKAEDAVMALTHMDTLDIHPDSFAELMETVGDCRGVILSTPVYFGDRSSVANKFLQIASLQGLLRDKIFGMVSVGAKRNGGQETTNIFGIYEAISQGALAVGNGPPTSQYGGTAIGGGMGHVLEDTWGLETAMGTGTKVAQVSQIASRGFGDPFTGRVSIAILVAIDTRDKILSTFVRKLTRQVAAHVPEIDFQIVDLIDHTIYRCLGCKTCPKNKEKPGVLPHCIIKDPDDSMEKIHKILKDADGIIVAGLNPVEVDKLIFRYQVVTERMRFIRRNDFELTNKLFTGLCLHQFGATINPIHSLKSIVSYLRHNVIIHRPIEIFEHEGRILDSGLTRLVEFCQMSKILSSGRKMIALEAPLYLPFGKGSGYKP